MSDKRDIAADRACNRCQHATSCPDAYKRLVPACSKFEFADSSHERKRDEEYWRIRSLKAEGLLKQIQPFLNTSCDECDPPGDVSCGDCCAQFDQVRFLINSFLTDPGGIPVMVVAEVRVDGGN